jgi:deoxyribose-phosphate aldolase
MSHLFDEKAIISNPSLLAGLIDHTLLRSDASREEMRSWALEAKKYNFASLCIYPKHLQWVIETLGNSPIKPIAVIAFPNGNIPTALKLEEVKKALAWGALELDMVISTEDLKSKRYREVLEDIEAVVRAAHPVPVKVILETAALEEREKVIGAALAKAARAAFVKTSTGFGPGGATPEDVALLRSTVGPEMGVKASGGIRTFDAALAMIRAGADRLGAFASLKIIQGHPSEDQTYEDGSEQREY